MSLIYRGRCWKFGDDLSCDGDMIPLNLALSGETRPEVLRASLLTGKNPDFPAKVVEGDLILAGSRFGSGHAHPQAAYALAAAKVGVVAASVPRGQYRNLVMAGVPFLTRAFSAFAACEDGDELEVDFGAGTIANLSCGTMFTAERLPDELLATIRCGGWKAMISRRIQNRNGE